MSEIQGDERVTAGDALALIGKSEPSALKMVGDLMEYSARATAWGFEQSYLGEQNAHEQTKQRLSAATERLALMQYRMEWLMGMHDDPFGHPWDRGA